MWPCGSVSPAGWSYRRTPWSSATTWRYCSATKTAGAQWTYVHTSLANSREYVVEANTDRGAELNPGDLVIISGNLNLADGSEVTLGENR